MPMLWFSGYGTRFYKYYLHTKAFTLWKNNVRFKLYCQQVGTAAMATTPPPASQPLTHTASTTSSLVDPTVTSCQSLITHSTVARHSPLSLLHTAPPTASIPDPPCQSPITYSTTAAASLWPVSSCSTTRPPSPPQH